MPDLREQLHHINQRRMVRNDNHPAASRQFLLPLRIYDEIGHAECVHQPEKALETKAHNGTGTKRPFLRIPREHRDDRKYDNGQDHPPDTEYRKRDSVPQSRQPRSISDPIANPVLV